MSLWSALKNSNTVANMEEAFGAKDITTAEMREAIKEWGHLYFDAQASKDEDPALRLPVTIVGKLYKTVFSEYVATLTKQSDFFGGILRGIGRVQKKAMQFALIGGEVFVKPVISGGKIDFVVIRRDNFVPFARDVYGKITSVGTMERTSESGRFYTLLERRTVMDTGELVIQNQLYSSTTEDVLGNRVALSTLARYAEIAEEIRLPGVYNLGMVQLRTPNVNTVDGSEDSVSVYDAAKGLIRNANHNQALLGAEFDNGKSLLIGSADMIATDQFGRKSIPDSLFVGIDDNISDTGVTIFNPTLREESYLSREQNLLKAAENLIGLKRGILSDVEAAERTATEITSTAGDYNLTIQDFQQAWEDAFRELLATCQVLGKLYQLTSDTINPEKDVVVDWGDGVLYNRDKVNQEMLMQVQSGLLAPERYLAWYYELPCETEADRAKIRADYMPKMEQLLQE